MAKARGRDGRENPRAVAAQGVQRILRAMPAPVVAGAVDCRCRRFVRDIDGIRHLPVPKAVPNSCDALSHHPKARARAVTRARAAGHAHMQLYVDEEHGEIALEWHEECEARYSQHRGIYGIGVHI